MVLRIGQINAQRSAAAAANIEILMHEKNLDILCIQEPFSYKGKVRGYNSPSLVKMQPQNSKTPWVAAVAKKKNVDILTGVGDENDHIMCLKVMTGDLDFVIINVYCQYSLPLEGFLEKIERALNGLQTEKVLIVMDANARSELWHDRTTDEKGVLLEEFVYEKNLSILNKPNNPPTYVSGNGESNIDISLATGNLLRYVQKWNVDISCTTSDHNLIEIELEANIKIVRNWVTDFGYNINKADWQKFGRSVEQNFDEAAINSLNIIPADRAVNMFNKKLDKCCKVAMPRRKVAERTVPWWDSHLTSMRKKVMSAKKQLLRARKLNLVNVIEEYANTYKTNRNKYVSDIKKRKKEAWQRFVDVEGNRDPWGIVYRIVREKVGNPSIWTALRLPDGSKTVSLEETINVLLRKCVPEDNRTELSAECRALKQKVDGYINMNLEARISFMEISNALRKFKNKKAPGLDNFKIEIVKELWKRRPEAIEGLMNNCFDQRKFPRRWKEANLKIILKDQNRDRSLLSSYRPIALLSVVGKIYEKIIVNRIQATYKDAGLESPNQYGFKKGKGTDDAFVNVRRAIQFTDKKYIIAIFIDIEGAFDNLWWPAILARLVSAGCSTHILKVAKSYFKCRKVLVQNKMETFSRYMEKGCPQGSIIGPAAWIWTMDVVLNKLTESIPSECGEFIAYADDLACIVKGDTRSEILTYSERVIEILTTWCSSHKLKISEKKTVAVQFKGSLDESRLAIKINGKNIKFVNSVKYLGVIIDNRQNYIEHVKYLRTKIIQHVCMIKRIASERWGIKPKIQKVLYGAVALPIIRYGSVLWWEVVCKTTVRRNLLALQRALLLLMTKSCRTVSTAAVQVVAGAKPLSLEIIEDALIKRLKRNLSTTSERYYYREKETEQFNETVSMEIERIRMYIMDRWQCEWEIETRGRDTYDFIEDVSFAVRNKAWFLPNRFAVYLITGYGPINSTLNKRGLSEVSNCPICGEASETRDHIIFDCVGYENIRLTGISEYRNNRNELIKNEHNLEKFNMFAKNVFQKRSELLTE